MSDNDSDMWGPEDAQARGGPGVVATAAPAVPAPILPVTSMGVAGQTEVGRVLAEVQARAIMARNYPRSEQAAETALVRALSHPKLATRPKEVFYNYKRGDTRIIGLTVHVLREALRCWGNATTGISELRRLEGGSEMMAWAWDLESNAFYQITFYVPHVRDRSEDKGGRVEVEGARDTYEHVTNFAARRQREMIKMILPNWFLWLAEDTATAAVAGPAAELPARLRKAAGLFAAMKVSEEMLARWLDAPRASWGQMDLVRLRVLHGAILNRETTLEAEFPELAVGGSAGETLRAAQAATAPADGTAPAAAPPPAQPAAAEPAAPDAGSAAAGQPGAAAAAQPLAQPGQAPGPVLAPAGSAGAGTGESAMAEIGRLFTAAGLTGKSSRAAATRLAVCSMLARDHDTDPPVPLASPAALSGPQAGRVAQRLAQVLAAAGEPQDQARLRAALDELAGQCADLLRQAEGGQP